MEMSNCSIWLRDWLLRNGNWCLCDDVRREAVKAGYARRELKEARKALGVKTFHQWEDGAETQNWFWYLEVK